MSNGYRQKNKKFKDGVNPNIFEQGVNFENTEETKKKDFAEIKEDFKQYASYFRRYP